MSHLDLYKNDTNQFISYFKRSEKHVQELIVSDLFNCEYTNKEVIEFLEKEYSNLLRDVSFKNELSAESGSKENSNITVIRTNQKLGS